MKFKEILVMINFSCSSCGKKYRLDKTIIKSENAKFTCKKCGFIIDIDSFIKKHDDQSISDMQIQDTQKQNPSILQQSQFSQIQDLSSQTSQYRTTRDTIKLTWTNRLQIKVNAVLIPLIIVIMTTFALISYFSEKQKMEENLQNASTVAAKRLSVYLVEAFWSLDDEILQESLKAEMLDNNIYAINLIDRTGKVIYLGYKRDHDWKIIKNNSAIEGNNYTKADESIIKDSNKIGSVEVYFSSKFFVEQFNKSMYKLILTALLLVVTVSLAVYVVLNHMILKPINRLTDIANKISIGNLDLAIPIESKDEIGVLADAFARMKVSMEFAIKQLRKR